MCDGPNSLQYPAECAFLIAMGGKKTGLKRIRLINVWLM